MTFSRITGVQGTPVNIPGGVVIPSSGVALGDQDDNFIFSSSATTLTPGTNASLFVDTASPPSWYDGSARILTPGIYLAGFEIESLPTSGTGYLTLHSPLNGYFAYPIDGLVALSQQWTAMGFAATTRILVQPDVTVIGTPDVPPAFPVGWNATFDFFITSGGPSLSVTPYLQRLAYPS